ncbi:conserved hypothetical protein [Brucella melitensis bv. 3 str. Ether]|nr:conserved hypothetical protein [Brucella melitensis bv. 3 str. Ether]
MNSTLPCSNPQATTTKAIFRRSRKWRPKRPTSRKQRHASPPPGRRKVLPLIPNRKMVRIRRPNPPPTLFRWMPSARNKTGLLCRMQLILV